jgi:urease accessory protein
MPLIVDPASRALTGNLRLRFAPSDGRTVITEAKRTPPLHVQRALYLDPAWPGLARVALLNSTAGLFAGDRLATGLCVDEGAAVEVITPQMARAFAMPSGHAEVSTTISVAHGGYLEYLPEPLLLCRDAAVHTVLSVDIAGGAVAAVGEVVAFGRVARGELYAFRELISRVTVACGGESVLVERLAVEPESTDVTALFGGYAAYGSLYLLGYGVLQMLGSVRERLAASPGLLGGASTLQGGAGVVVRVLGLAPASVQASLRAMIGEFRNASCSWR